MKWPAWIHELLGQLVRLESGDVQQLHRADQLAIEMDEPIERKLQRLSQPFGIWILGFDSIMAAKRVAGL